MRENPTVIGAYLGVDHSSGSLWIGEPGNSYYVTLWAKEYDAKTGKMSEPRQQSTLEIVDDSEIGTPPSVGKMALLATVLKGKVPETVIERGIILESLAKSPAAS